MSLTKLVAGAVFAIGILSASSASALWKYNYTGPQFAGKDGFYGPQFDRITVEFFTLSKLNLFYAGTVFPIGISVSDGFQTIDNNTPGANFYVGFFTDDGPDLPEVYHFWRVVATIGGTSRIETENLVGFGDGGVDYAYYCPDVFCGREPLGYAAYLWEGYDAGEARSHWTETEIISPPPPGGVPEPATWAMMIMGFGAAGSMIRRRKAVIG